MENAIRVTEVSLEKEVLLLQEKLLRALKVNSILTKIVEGRAASLLAIVIWAAIYDYKYPAAKLFSLH